MTDPEFYACSWNDEGYCDLFERTCYAHDDEEEWECGCDDVEDDWDD